MSRSAQNNKTRLRSGQQSVKPVERRYSIQSDDSGHDYFVEVGNEGEFERWLSTFDGGIDWNEYDEDGGHDYEKNKIDGRFTFSDPRNE